MQDPWGSPWAITDDNAQPALQINVVPPPPPPTTLPLSAIGISDIDDTINPESHDDDAADGLQPRTTRLWPSGTDNSGADDTWDRWNDASSSPGWGRSPELRPVTTAASPAGWDGSSVNLALADASLPTHDGDEISEAEGERPPMAVETDKVDAHDGIAERTPPVSAAAALRDDSERQELVGAATTATATTETPPSALDELFPLASDTDVTSAAVPEVLADKTTADGFGTGSERRAWQRLSRFGTMRKHNLGLDDDHYVRIDWAHSSAVRKTTLKTVRRWMEEDSIAGRTVLGGGAKGRQDGTVGAAMFNWDSSAPQVEIGKLLLQRSSSKQGSAAAAAAAAGRPHSVIGHSSKTPSPLADEPRERPASAFLPSLRMIPPPSPPEKPAAAPRRDDDGDDEDDWGEMVSSPAVDGPANAAAAFDAWTQPETAEGSETRTHVDEEKEEEEHVGSAFDAPTSPRDTDPVPVPASVPVSVPSIEASVLDESAWQWDEEAPSKAASASAGYDDDAPEPISSGAVSLTTSNSPAGTTEIADDADSYHDAEETVAKVIDSLPDLSYMLR
ncbi:hypothetical protein GMORB2_3034 [Geosmithia morbida]|uniref:Uncharacterized protein n=1 Tax=Geosmithia morbida TaxID=1094350 RepID=A0A9P4YS23_9HYPO|nr:uncharacterized protein GMORB2_3034 [Geosmithia morbida]KAF4120596.1 hypothetical protein GMORB2_3034 [Geosmithia morbida]